VFYYPHFPSSHTHIMGMTQFLDTLHVSDGLSVHHHESETVHIHDAVCTVLNSWWWKERPSETCRVSLQNEINLRCCASGCYYYRNKLRCTVLQTSDLLTLVAILIIRPQRGPKAKHWTSEGPKCLSITNVTLNPLRYSKHLSKSLSITVL